MASFLTRTNDATSFFIILRKKKHRRGKIKGEQFIILTPIFLKREEKSKKVEITINNEIIKPPRDISSSACAVKK